MSAHAQRFLRPVDDDGVVQDGGHTPTNRLTETCSLCSLDLQRTSLILDILVMVN